MTRLHLIGVGLVAPGLPDWDTARAVLSGRRPYAAAPIPARNLEGEASALLEEAALKNNQLEAQAIDRTHRIGQKSQVIAYRLIARDTVEEKIRALQKEKAALAAAVVQEESLATVLDLGSLRKILA